MIEWSESQLMIRDAIRRFVEAEIAPHVEELEHGHLPPYAILRKMYPALRPDHMARAPLALTPARPGGARPRRAWRPWGEWPRWRPGLRGRAP